MAVTVAGLPFDFVKANTASGAAGFVMKSTRDAYYFNAGVLTKITDVDYPDPTVPGVEYLDGYFFVMNADGELIILENRQRRDFDPEALIDLSNSISQLGLLQTILGLS